MECSICFNAITSQTGKVELSCSHPFHFSCLTTWFDKQKMSGGCENCPLCRHEGGEFEKMPGAIVDQDDDDETWEYVDRDEPTSTEVLAQERTRERFARMKFLNPEHEMQLYAANLIKACWRGYQDRLTFNTLAQISEDVEFHQRVIKTNTREIQELTNSTKFLKATLGLSRTQVKHMAAIRIQSLWRRHKVTTLMKEGPHDIKLTGVWRKVTSTKWEKVIMNPEEDTAASMLLHPRSKIVPSDIAITIAAFEADVQAQLAMLRNITFSN